MPHNVRKIGGTQTLECTPDGKKFETDRDAVELISEALQLDARLIVIPVERFGEDFFRLRTRIAGEIVQKFVQYRQLLAIVGDISKHTDASSAYAAFVTEANAGRDIWFVRDLSGSRDA